MGKIKKSFYDWCIENNHQDLLDRWDYNLNKKSPKDVGCQSSKIKIYLKCPRGIHKSSSFSPAGLCNSKKPLAKCRECNTLGQYLLDTFGADAIDVYWSDKNNDSPFDYTLNAPYKVWINCVDNDYHGAYDVQVESFTRGCRCPYCSGNRVHKNDSVGYNHPEIFNYWSNKNSKSPYEISLMSNLKYIFECDIHGEFVMAMSEFVRAGCHCTHCSRDSNISGIEKAVRNYLDELHVKYLNEYQCTINPINPKTNMPLPYDNEIPELKLIIEVHGKQHYTLNSFSIAVAKEMNITPEEAFLYQQWKDKFKKDYALSNGYYYLEIPYTMFNKNDDYKKLINNKIEEITHQQRLNEKTA